MKKLLFGIFICLGFVLAMSHNVGAIELTIDLDSYSLKRNSNRPNLTLFWNSDTTTCASVGQCRVFDSSDFSFVKKMTTNTSYEAKANDVFILRMFVGSQSRTGPYSNIATFMQRNFTTNNDYLIYLGQNVFRVDEARILSDLGYGPNADEFYTRLSNYYYDLRVYEYYFRAVRDGSYQVGFESTNYSSNTGDIFALPAYSTDGAVYFQILNLTQYGYKKSAQETEAEQEIQSTENIENQTPPSQNETGDGAAATNLIGAFSGFVSALGGLSATNCNLTLNFPDFAGGSRVVNVCQNKDKAGNIISVFSSLTLIIFYVPLAIRLLTMIYNEIRSFTNG